MTGRPRHWPRRAVAARLLTTRPVAAPVRGPFVDGVARVLLGCALIGGAPLVVGAQPTPPARITPAATAARIMAGVAIPAAYRRPLEAALTELASPRKTRVGTFPSDLTCATTTTTARLVDLDGDSVPEVLLRASGPCADGGRAVNAPEWLLARDSALGTWSVVADEYTGFAPLRSRTRGHVDLVTSAGTSVTYLRWDGQRYRGCMVSNFTGDTCTGWRPGEVTGDSLATFGVSPGRSRPATGPAAATAGPAVDAALGVARDLVTPLGLNGRLARGLAEAVARIIAPPAPELPEQMRCQYTAIAARLVDLNDDATPEVELHADPACPMVGGVAHWLFVRDIQTGAWAMALDEGGPLRALDTRAAGFRDVVLPPRSSGWVPVYRWIGNAYAPYCNIVSADRIASDRPCPPAVRRANAGSRLPAFAARASSADDPRATESGEPRRASDSTSRRRGGPSRPSRDAGILATSDSAADRAPVPGRSSALRLAPSWQCSGVPGRLDLTHAAATREVRAAYAVEYLRLENALRALDSARAAVKAGDFTQITGAMYAALFRAVYFTVPRTGTIVPPALPVLNRTYEAWTANLARYRTGGRMAVEEHWRDYFGAAERANRRAPGAWTRGELDDVVRAATSAFFAGDLPRATTSVRAQLRAEAEPAARAEYEGAALVLDSAVEHAAWYWQYDMESRFVRSWGPNAAAALTAAPWTSPAEMKRRWSEAWVGASRATEAQPESHDEPACPGFVPATRTRVVYMHGDERGYRSEPRAVVVEQGDAVTFVLVSGGPHNVAFVPDAIPQGTADRLDANLYRRSGLLATPMLLNRHEGVTVSFAGLPPGRYHYRCVPHTAMAQYGVVVVVPRSVLPPEWGAPPAESR